MTKATAAVSPLRRRMIDDMSLRNLSPATQRSYLHAVTKFSRYFGRSPDHLGLEDVRAFQVHLVSQGISWPALNQTVCALRFFYGVTLDREEIPERIAYARTPRKLPAILSADEVVRFLEAVPSLKARAALTTAYAAGLRASEAVSLKVTDIDSGRMVIQICHGKGAKDRTVMLSPQLLKILRTYWRLARPRDWLFPGRGPDKPIDVQVLHAACRSATKAAGLTKQVSVHTLRHNPSTACQGRRSGEPSPPICSRAGSTSGSSRCCSVTTVCRPRRATPMWRRPRSPRRRARPIGSSWRWCRRPDARPCARRWRWRTCSAAMALPIAAAMTVISAASSGG